VHRFGFPVTPLLQRVLALVACCCALAQAVGEETGEQKRSYNLPPGDASATLNQFAAVSEHHLIFMVAKVRGVQTNAVVGEFYPTEALGQMLMNTELRAIVDPDSGSFVVTRRETSGDASLVKAGTPSNPENDPPMKRPHLLHRLAAAASLLLATQAEAQTVNAAPPKDEVLTLSPFEVTGSDEKGYAATSSLVGSRVKTELKDIASQIDVMTPEFLQDIGATSIADAVAYSSNFGGPNDQNIGPNDGVASISLEGRARGQDAATVSTDFYATNLPIDFYNIERLNLAYGAQSVLFGLGGAGGVLDSSTKRAQLRNRSTLEWRYDSWDGKRGILDLNRVLIANKLAVRLVGLRSDTEQFTEGGQDRSRRGFGAFAFTPFSKTTVRGSFEYVDVGTRRATNYVSKDFLSPWINAGRPLFDNSKGNAAIAASDPLLSKNSNALRVLSYGVGDDSYTVWNGSAVTKGPHQLPGVTDQGAYSLTDGRIYPVARDPRVSSRENDITGRQFRFSIEQKITNDLFFEFGFNHEVRDELAGGTFDNAESVNLLADANAYLPGGTAAKAQTVANPNAGKLYIESFPHGNVNYNSTQEARLTGFFEFDAAKHLRDRFGWLGRHRLAALVSTREDRTESQEERAIVLGNPSFATGDKLNNSRLLRSRYYLDSPSDRASNGNYTATPIPGTGIFGPWTVTDPATNSPATYALFHNPDGSGFLPIGSKIKVDTMMGALQSFFWKDRVNVFAGLRSDHVKSYTFSDASTVRHDQNKPGDQLGLYPHLNEASYNAAPDAVKTSILRTYGVVVHPLPWLSLFYNTSANTSLPPGRYGPFGNPLIGTSANGYDYGVRFDGLGNRLSMRLNFYEDNQVDLWANPFTQLRDFSAAVEQRLRGADKPAGIGAVAASTFDPVAKPVDLYRSLTDKGATGLDLTLVANPSPNWTLRATVGRQVNLLQKRGAEWIAWINQRLPVWKDAGGLGWDKVTISSTDSRSIHEYYDTVILPQIASQQSALGLMRFREREWRANFFTNYRFTQERLKGLNLGGGVRWAGPAFTGHAGKLVPGIATPVDDTSIRFVHAKAQTFCDAVVGYKHRFTFLGNRNLNFQLNVRNLFDQQDLEVSRTNHLGVDYEFLRVPPRQFILTTALEF
jgi:iron complex outermembrane receptor protein